MGGPLLSAKAQHSLSRPKPLLPTLDACHNLFFQFQTHSGSSEEKQSRNPKISKSIFMESTAEKPPTNRFLLAATCYLIASY
jgi:hypothetical protein